MSTAGESSPPIFSDENKFDGTNWVAWSKFIHIAAQMKGIFGYLDGTIKDPRVPTTLFSPTSIPIAPSNTKAI